MVVRYDEYYKKIIIVHTDFLGGKAIKLKRNEHEVKDENWEKNLGLKVS